MSNSMGEKTTTVRKAVVLAGGLGTRFLPLSKAVPKELWPVVDKPVIHYVLEEIRAIGLDQVILVLPSKESLAISYFKRDIKLEKILEKRKKEQTLAVLKNFQDLYKGISFSFIFQEKPLGDGDAILKAKTKIGREPFALLFCDVIVESKIPSMFQLLKVFKTSQRPVVALSKVSKDEVSAFGIAAVEKIAKRFFKIKKIVEKPKAEEAPSDLALVGKYILTPEVFDYLEAQKKAMPSKEIILANALEALLIDGKTVYGYELEGKWLGCGNKINWLKTHLYLSLKSPEYGEQLRKYLKEIV